MRRMFDWDCYGEKSMFSFVPNLNVAETESGYEVAMDLPGMNPETGKMSRRTHVLPQSPAQPFQRRAVVVWL
jgi:hypothetical protein